MTAIGPDTRVTLHFSILLETGEEIDSTRRSHPATFTVGDGSLLPGFEQALFGLSPGADEQIPIAARDGFGAQREENLRFMPIAQFSADLIPEPGLVVSFAGPGGELPGVVRSVEGELVVVDFNHPLAGKNLIFDVSILKVEPVSR
jgi:FKBP-type peptidyl-prolyl cis-trans isomerase SlpA